MNNVKGLRSANWHLQNSREGVKYSMGNVVNNNEVTTYGVRWTLDSSRGSLHRLYKCRTTIVLTYLNVIDDIEWQLQLKNKQTERYINEEMEGNVRTYLEA